MATLTEALQATQATARATRTAKTSNANPTSCQQKVVKNEQKGRKSVHRSLFFMS